MENNEGVAGTGSGLDLADSTVWSDLQEYNFTAPAGMATLRILLRAKTNGDIVWYDKVDVMEYTAFGTTGLKLYNAVSGGAQSLVGNTGIDPNDISTVEVFKVLGSDNLTGSMTVLMWVKPDDGQPAAENTIITNGYDYGADKRSVNIALRTSGKIVMVATSDGAAANGILTDAAVFSNGAQTNYKFIGGVYDQSVPSGVIYVDGSAVATSNFNGGVGATLLDGYQPLTIGGSYNSGTPSLFFNGQVGLLMAFERALSAAEIQRIRLQLLEDGLISLG